MKSQCIHQSTVVIPMTGMYHHSCIFINHNYIIIFINDIKRNILWNNNVFSRRMSEQNRNFVTGTNSIILFYGISVYHHVSGAASLGNLVSGGVLTKIKQKFINPQWFLVFINFNVEMFKQTSRFIIIR